MIHVDIFTGALRCIGFFEEEAKAVEWLSFGYTGGANFETCEVVQNEDPASLAVKTNKVGGTGQIGGMRSTSERKIDGEAGLPAEIATLRRQSAIEKGRLLKFFTAQT